MTDLYNIVSEDRDPIKKLMSKIPGFKGYIEQVDRRNSDKLLRETIAKDYEALYQRISSLQRDLISQGGLAYIDDLENAAIKIRQFTTASICFMATRACLTRSRQKKTS